MDTEVLRRRIDEAARTVSAERVGETIPRTEFDRQSESFGANIDDASLPAMTLAREGKADLVEIDTLGSGGMGRVVLAFQPSLGRQVAVKTLNDDGVPAHRAALVREAFLTGALEHPAIVPVHAFGVDSAGRPLLVMKRVEGVSWKTLLRDPTHEAWSTHLGDPPDRLEANLDVLSSVCRALELAHARGIVHRDIKPDNVMVGAFGEVYLVDWGIGRPMGATASEGIVGTPAYMAPEMVYGGDVDARTDVYLLGATLHELLTGRYRHEAGLLADVLALAAKSEPATYASSVPAALGELANRACASDPAMRPVSARAFREGIASWKRHRGAIELCAAARARVERLRELFELAGEAPPSDLALAYRLAAEARFGFIQAGEQAKELLEATDGLREAIEALVELELRQGHADTAAALLAECPTPAPSLTLRIEETRRRQALDAHERARLREVDRALDPSFGRRSRALPLLAITVLEIGVGALEGAHVVTATPRSAMSIVGVVIAMTAIASVLQRRKIFGHPYNRRVWALLVLTLAAMFVNRATVLATTNDIVRALTGDLFSIGVMLAAGALFITPRLFVATAVVAISWVVSLLQPETTATLFHFALALAALASAWAVATSRRMSR